MSKAQHGQEGAVVERRLRPIYDWLDCGNNKKALQEADKVLKKTPALQCARALKAISLLRLGQEQDSSTIIEALAAETPTDDATLQAMTICLREAYKLDKICSVYEAAVKADPTNEELHTHYFMSLVRMGDAKAQQRAAMALYKLAPKNPYYFWAIMSILIQAKADENGVTKSVLLALAQRMVDKFIVDQKLEAEQEASLYIIILTMQNKHKEALEFMEGSLYNQLASGSMPQVSIPQLIQLGRWKKLNVLSKELLWDNPDRWDFYRNYLDSSFHLMKGESDETGVNNANTMEKNSKILDTPDDTPEKCHEFLCQVIENISPGKMIRGPYLARLDLYKRLVHESKDPVSLMGRPVDLILDYLREFGHKPCCASDLRPYLEMIPKDERTVRRQDFFHCSGANGEGDAKDANEVQRGVSGARLLLACGGHVASTDLCVRYTRAAAVLGENPTTTEFGPADAYAVLAAHAFYAEALESKRSKPIVQALCLLEHVMQQSPSNFHCKLLLIKLYHFIGCGWGAHVWYDELSTKHVQLASLSWLHADRLSSACLYQQASFIMHSTVWFYTHHEKDCVDHRTFSYKYGTFGKLLELEEFGSQLRGSLGAARCAAELALVGAVFDSPSTQDLTNACNAAYVDRICWEKLTDLSDLSVFVEWQPPERKQVDAPKIQFEQDTMFARLKAYLVKAVALSLELAEGKKSLRQEEKETKEKALEESIQEFDQNFKNFAESSPIAISQECINTPLPSRLLAFINSPIPFREIYFNLFSAVVSLSQNSLEAGLASLSSGTQLLESARGHVADVLSAQIKATDALWTQRETLEELSNVLEVISLVCVVCGVCNDLTRSHQGKKNKKKGSIQTHTEIKISDTMNQVSADTSKTIKTIEDHLDKWETTVVQRELIDEFAKLNLNKNFDYSVVTSRLVEGHKKVLENIRKILKNKIKFLISLR